MRTSAMRLTPRRVPYPPWEKISRVMPETGLWYVRNNDPVPSSGSAGLCFVDLVDLIWEGAVFAEKIEGYEHGGIKFVICFVTAPDIEKKTKGRVILEYGEVIDDADAEAYPTQAVLDDILSKYDQMAAPHIWIDGMRMTIPSALEKIVANISDAKEGIIYGD